MGGFEINTIRDKYDEARRRELKELLDPKTGELSLQFSEYIDYPLYSNDDNEVIFLFDLGHRLYMFARKL
jgi:hypothetical protein